MDIRCLYTIHTAENVDLDVELAGIATRVFAFLIDSIVMLLMMVMVMLTSSILERINPEISKTLGPLMMFAVFFGYHFFQEWLWNGKTLGKHFFNIRVVRNNGQAIGFWEAFGRNLMRLIDVYGSGIGLLIMLFSKQEKRFGDYLAGTVVVSLDKNELHKPLSLAASDKSVAPPLYPADNLSAEEYELLRDFIVRKKQLFHPAQQQLESSIRQYFQHKLHLPQTTCDEPGFLEDLYHSYRESMRT